MALGHLKFEKLFGSESQDWLSGLYTKEGGNLILTGHTNGTLGEENFGLYDGFITAINNNGEINTIHQFGTSKTEYVYAISTLSNNNQNNENDNENIDVIIGGCTDGEFAGSNFGSFDTWIGSYNTDINDFKWKIQFGSTQWDWVHSLDTITSNDGVSYVAMGGVTLGDLKGISKGGHDIWFGILNGQDGSVKWLKQIGSPVNDWLYHVTFDETSKDILIGGVTKGALVGESFGNSDIWVGRYDQDGIKKWVVQLGTTENDFLQSIVVTPNGDVFIGGYTNGIFTQINNSFDVYDSQDIPSIQPEEVTSYVAKLDSLTGSILWLKQYPHKENRFDYFHKMEYNLITNKLLVAGTTKPQTLVKHSRRRKTMRRRRTRRRNLKESTENRKGKVKTGNETQQAAITSTTTSASTLRGNKNIPKQHRRLEEQEEKEKEQEDGEMNRVGFWVGEVNMETGHLEWIERKYFENNDRIEVNAMSLSSSSLNPSMNNFQYLSIGGIITSSSSTSSTSSLNSSSVGNGVSSTTNSIPLTHMWYHEYQLPTQPTSIPIPTPTYQPTIQPTNIPTIQPTNIPTMQPLPLPTYQPTLIPIPLPTTPNPTYKPTYKPTSLPTLLPSSIPTSIPTLMPISYLASLSQASLLHHLNDHFYLGTSFTSLDNYSIYAMIFGIMLLIISWKLQKSWSLNKRRHGMCAHNDSLEFELQSPRNNGSGNGNSNGNSSNDSSRNGVSGSVSSGGGGGGSSSINDDENKIQNRERNVVGGGGGGGMVANKQPSVPISPNRKQISSFQRTKFQYNEPISSNQQNCPNGNDDINDDANDDEDADDRTYLISHSDSYNDNHHFNPHIAQTSSTSSSQEAPQESLQNKLRIGDALIEAKGSDIVHSQSHEGSSSLGLFDLEYETESSDEETEEDHLL